MTTMTDPRLAEALERAAEKAGLLRRDGGHLARVAGQYLDGWGEAAAVLDTVSADGKCGYCERPIQSLPEGDIYCACTTKRPCRHRYFTRPGDPDCVPCKANTKFIRAMLGEHHG